MASLYRIHLDLAPLVAELQTGWAPRVSYALERISEKTKDVWIKRVKQQSGIWLVEKNRYIASIDWRWTGLLSTEVWTDYEVADLIENGRPARDLKKMLDTSRKVRRTESGKRFLVIPFRHNTPGHDALTADMSKQAYAMAVGMKMSKVTKLSQRGSGEITHMNPRLGMRAAVLQTPFASDLSTRGAMMTEKRHYAWGDRLTVKALRAAGMDEADVKRYAGMVRMPDIGGKKRSSQYLTFRIMMEGQSGWVIPAQPGRHIAQDVAREMEPIAKTMLERATTLDAG